MPTTQPEQPTACEAASRPRLGVLATHPIQYQAPLYQEIARRDVVDLEVAFLSSGGAQPVHDPGFGVTLAWDIDLLGGYRSTVLARRPLAGKPAWLRLAASWLRRQDIVVLHGHTDPDMLLAMAACRVLGLPYLLRGDSHAELVTGRLAPDRQAPGGGRRCPRRGRGAADRAAQCRLLQPVRARPPVEAPYSVDNDRFRVMSDAARPSRAARLASLGLDPRRPTVIFSGKLVVQKRPLDAVRAIDRSAGSLNLLLLGDGPLRAEVRGSRTDLPVRCLGFVNQAELPGWYGCGDILGAAQRPRAVGTRGQRGHGLRPDSGGQRRRRLRG